VDPSLILYPKWLRSTRRAKISFCRDFETLSSADGGRFRDKEMASLPKQNPYQCDQCGTPDIVAMPVLYQQGTHTYSSPFGWGSRQSHSALAAASPRPKSYIRPFLLWGFANCFFFFWGIAGLSAVPQHPKTAGTIENAVAIFLVMGFACLVGMILNIRRISRYNRDVYPRLHWDWEHTYKCRRCGSLRLIDS
jgi:hypothetical protein